MRCFLCWCGLLLLTAIPLYAQSEPVSIDLSYAKLRFNPTGSADLLFADGTVWKSGGLSAFELTCASGDTVQATGYAFANDRLTVRFADGAQAVFEITAREKYAYFNLVEFNGPGKYDMFRFMRLGAPPDAKIADLVNKAVHDGKSLTLLTAAPNVRPLNAGIGGSHSDRAGCSHSITRAPEGKVGSWCARFTASCNEKTGGWSVSAKSFPHSLNIKDYKSYRVWVCGDGSKCSLKIQLHDRSGGVRDDYIPIDFTGWKLVDLNKPALNTLNHAEVSSMYLYYNGLPANKTVTCLVDQIEVVKETDGRTETIVLDDFESVESPYWADAARPISLVSYAKHGLLPFKFGVICCADEDWVNVVPDFQTTAGLPSPRFDGLWNKKSKWIKESYFFLTQFKESQYDEALAIAKRGNFKMILLLTTWCKNTGHYEINTAHYPDGIESLKRVIARFNAEGIKVGLHFLAASIDRGDSWLRPTPDKRLVKGARVTLAADLDAKATFVETTEPPTGFPLEEGKSYVTPGRTLWIDDELLYYDTVSLEKPYGFKGCRRGYNQTVPAAHVRGVPVDHLVRAYGYYMYDLDSTLADEVAARFGAVADQLNLDMIYFDGSERLQRPEDGADHWYYNAKLHKIFFDHIKNKNILYQGSSTSPYSWHQMSRSASADGHDDLKAYLEERSGGFATYYNANCLPLDIGWYYAYDTQATLDMYEYVLCATIAYDSSMSLQVSVDAAKKHPFTGEILDMIRKYDDLRVSGRVPGELREAMRLDPRLAGKKTEEERNALLDLRHDFRYVKTDKTEGFQRVVYSLWNKVDPADPKTFQWDFVVKNGKAKIGFQVQVLPDPKAKADVALVNPRVEVAGKTLALPMSLTVGQYGICWPGEKIGHYGQPLPKGEYLEQKGDVFELPDGTYHVTFACDGTCPMPVRVRMTQTPEEFHAF